MASLQVTNPDRYVDYGVEKRFRVFDLPASRGTVVDRNGTDLALSIRRPSIVADPTKVVDPLVTANALAPLVGADPAVLAERLDRDTHFAYVARGVDDGTASAVGDLALAGISVIEEPARENPAGSFASAVLGRTDGWEQGSTGVELQYDQTLQGAPGQMVVETAPNGQRIADGDLEIEPAVPGETVVLSIDRALQFQAEQVLAGAIERTGARGGVLLAADPETGEILADANLVVDEFGRPIPGTEHQAVTWVFEPGSVLKPITFAGVFEDGVGTPGSTMLVPDTVQVYDQEFQDDHAHEPANWTIRSIVSESSNVGTVQWSDQLGDARLYHWMDAFGFGRRTGLGFPGEARGILPPLADWSGVTSATVSFGQGIAVTPMQMLRAFSIIANGGTMVEPRLVLGTRDADGTFHAAPASEPQRVVSEQTSTWLRSVLRGVVEEGTGIRAEVPGLQIAGKTGTAWKPVEDTPALNADGEEDAYGEETGGIRYVATFAGFLPADHPELVVVVVLDEPRRPDYSGGRASAPAFAEFASFAARQLRINGVHEAVARTGERVRVLPEPEPAPPIIDLDGDGLDDSLSPTTTLAPS